MNKMFKLVVCICFLLIVYLTYRYVDNNYINSSYAIQVEETSIVESNEPIVVEEEKVPYNKLMIVAHPDDESIFGGYHLLSDEYYVVCVTCGVNNTRLEEFKTVMGITNDKYEYLSHTDMDGNYIISDWSSEYNTIEQELINIINRQDWDLIVTHNPKGEYGHKQHKMINKMVTDNVEDKSKLYYFGEFYSNDTENSSEVLTDEQYALKRNLLNVFVSQSSLPETSRLSYMFRNENWIQYNDWSY